MSYKFSIPEHRPFRPGRFASIAKPCAEIRIANNQRQYRRSKLRSCDAQAQQRRACGNCSKEPNHVDRGVSAASCEIALSSIHLQSKEDRYSLDIYPSFPRNWIAGNKGFFMQYLCTPQAPVTRSCIIMVPYLIRLLGFPRKCRQAKP